MTKPSDFKPVERAQAHWIEWLTGLLSAVGVIAMIGWLGVEALGQSRQSPDLSVEVVGTQMRSGGYQVSFEVSNAADATAAGVVVRGQIIKGEATVETVETTLDYVPMHSTAGGGLIFQHDPRGQLRIAAIGYSVP